jgi:hypothetical protein
MLWPGFPGSHRQVPHILAQWEDPMKRDTPASLAEAAGRRLDQSLSVAERAMLAHDLTAALRELYAAERELRRLGRLLPPDE